MNESKKILCATDFSAGAAQAQRSAAWLASERNAELVILHAWHVPASAYSEVTVPEEVLQFLREDAQQGLDRAMRDAKTEGAERVRGKLASGVPWLTITEELSDPTYDVAVIGTHGRTGIARMLLGSVATMVVRHAPCSVLVVRSDSEPKHFEHALCPIDFSPSSRDAMFAAARVVRRGGSITLLHAMEMPVVWTGEASIDFASSVAERSTETLEQWSNELRRAVDVRVTTHTELGRPGQEILRAIDEDTSIDIVVMGSHGRTGIKRALLGSVTEKVVRHARCPVLVSRTRE